MNSDKIIDRAEMIFDGIIKHLSESDCDHCKQMLQKYFKNE
jgi:hypothetical protein